MTTQIFRQSTIQERELRFALGLLGGLALRDESINVEMPTAEHRKLTKLWQKYKMTPYDLVWGGERK